MAQFTKEQKEQNSLIAMGHLTSKGWSPMQAAAIVGNLTVESYMNPNTPRGDGGTAAGLAQWRFDRLDKFKEIIGTDAESATLKQQLDFVDWELRNSHKKAGALLVAAKNIEEATLLIDKYYERSAGHHGEKRIKHAKNALNNWTLLTGKIREAGGPKPSSSIITQLLEFLIELFKRK